MGVKLSVQDLSVWYGDNQVLAGINLDVPENAVTAIIGPSGCGKSTFIRCLNRMHEMVPTASHRGKIFFNHSNIYGEDIDPILLRREIGMVFQKPNPFPHMSIEENVLSGLKLTNRLKKADASEVVEKALKDAALWEEVKDRLSSKATSLSGGQQQRLCIARTLAVQPEVILMDEPCSALDPIATSKIEDLLHKLKEKYTIIIVTHNMQQAARVSGKTAFFLQGDLIEFNETNLIFTSPNDRRTEDYITGKFG